jgi:hypothetical protein
MTCEGLKPGHEYVDTVTHYYDGPRKGIANDQGRPQFYECVFDEIKGSYSELFSLAPVDSETFRSAMEDWTIWQRWELAYHAGKTERDTHPALPHESARRAELQGILDKVLVIDPQGAIAKIGRFEALGNASLPKGVLRPYKCSGRTLRLRNQTKSCTLTAMFRGETRLATRLNSAYSQVVVSATRQ